MRPSFELSATSGRPSGDALFAYVDADPDYGVSPDKCAVGLRMAADSGLVHAQGDFSHAL